MNPLEFTQASVKPVSPVEMPGFKKFEAPGGFHAPANPTKVAVCASLDAYRKFLSNNPHVDILSTCSITEGILVTYKGRLGK